MVDGDYMSLVKTRPVGQWRETLAVLATYTGADQWASLCDALASRLAQTGMHHAASLCYICAGNVDQVRLAGLLSDDRYTTPSLPFLLVLAEHLSCTYQHKIPHPRE